LIFFVAKTNSRKSIACSGKVPALRQNNKTKTTLDTKYENKPSAIT